MAADKYTDTGRAVEPEVERITNFYRKIVKECRCFAATAIIDTGGKWNHGATCLAGSYRDIMCMIGRMIAQMAIEKRTDGINTDDILGDILGDVNTAAIDVYSALQQKGSGKDG